jgi:hypothetical protein
MRRDVGHGRAARALGMHLTMVAHEQRGMTTRIQIDTQQLSFA